MPYVVMYRAASRVSRVDDTLAGCFLYFADPHRPLDEGYFVEKLVVWADVPGMDATGKPFRLAKESEL